MKTLVAGMFAVTMIAAVTPVAPVAQGSGSNHSVTKTDLERWKKELSNWDRWGKDDQVGALNLITPAIRKRAAALVKEGVSVSLAREALTEKAVDNFAPYDITYQFSAEGHGSDRLNISYHGYTPDKALVAKEGHPRNSIYNLKNGIVTRGILMDIARLKGVPYLEPGTPIYVEDLEAW